MHNRIADFDRTLLVTFCIEQMNVLIAHYDRESTRVKLSLKHEVSYDRSAALAEAHSNFVKESRNYRYLLEACLSVQKSGAVPITSEIALDLIATIDWLMVLYLASDVLHNGIDVAGLELDNFFVPHVNYSSGWDEEGRLLLQRVQT